MEERNHKEPPAATGGGWGFSLSVFSDLQKAAEDISRNAVAVAKGIAADLQSDLDSHGEEGGGAAAEDTKSTQAAAGDDSLSSSALDRLERASEDSLLGQGLEVLDNSMETFASGAWQAFGTAWKGSSTLVHKKGVFFISQYLDKMKPVFCGNLDLDAEESEVERLFRRYGKVEKVKDKVR